MKRLKLVKITLSIIMPGFLFAMPIQSPPEKKPFHKQRNIPQLKKNLKKMNRIPGKGSVIGHGTKSKTLTQKLKRRNRKPLKIKKKTGALKQMNRLTKHKAGIRRKSLRKRIYHSYQTMVGEMRKRLSERKKRIRQSNGSR